MRTDDIHCDRCVRVCDCTAATQAAREFPRKPSRLSLRSRQNMRLLGGLLRIGGYESDFGANRPRTREPLAQGVLGFEQQFAYGVTRNVMRTCDPG